MPIVYCLFNIFSLANLGINKHLIAISFGKCYICGKLLVMRVWLIFFCALFMVACEHKSENFTVEAQIEGLENGTRVYLSKYEGFNLATVDSAVSQSGQFEFNIPVSDTTLAVISIDEHNSSIFFFLDNAPLRVQGHIDSLYTTNINGSNTNEDFVKVRNHINRLNQQANNLFLNSRNIPPEDTLKIRKQNEDFYALQNEIKSYSLNFARQHPESHVSLFLLFDLINTVNDEELQELPEIYYSLQPSIQKSALGVSFLEQLNRLNSLVVGATAPDFIAPTTEGDAFKLSTVKAEIIILDFWASWCGPCRSENPKLAKLYKELHPRGLEIVSVSLDNSRELWKEAIQKDGIGAWHHVSNLMFLDEPVAKDYGVLAIPKTFVLDTHFNILAIDLRGSDLEKFIRENL